MDNKHILIQAQQYFSRTKNLIYYVSYIAVKALLLPKNSAVAGLFHHFSLY